MNTLFVRHFFIVFLIVSATVLLSACSSLEQPDQHPPEPNVIWRADFESASLANWHYLLNPQGIKISNENAADGKYAAHIMLQGTDDYLWNANPELNRSELQYQSRSVFEGSRTHLSFKFMLPETLPNTKHEIAYWESNKTYQQIMRFTLFGNRLSFGPSNSQNALNAQTIGDQAIEILPMTWYRVDMYINWSVENASVNVRINNQLENNELELANLSFPTLIDENEQAFFQIGLLRAQDDQAISIWIDDVVEYAHHYQ